MTSVFSGEFEILHLPLLLLFHVIFIIFFYRTSDQRCNKDLLFTTRRTSVDPIDWGVGLLD